MIIGFDVAPVAPSARFVFTKSGSIESSQSLVPVAMRDCSGELIASSFGGSLIEVFRLIEIISQAAGGKHLLSKAGRSVEAGEAAKMLPIAGSATIPPILTVIPLLRARWATMNESQ